MPTYQGIDFLERSLEALAGQVCPLPWDFRAIDSGSNDGTLEVLERFRGRFPVPFVVEGIHKSEFDHGDTRNLLAARSSGDLLVFLTQDAIPSRPNFLERLARNFENPRIGAVTCRNVPRPDARPSTVILCQDDPGYSARRREVELPHDYAKLGPHQRRLLYNFNDVASAIPRELWERHPFPRTAFGEDILMARALLEGGFVVAYDADATVEHSHDYDEQETLARARIDGRFNAEWLGRICIERRSDIDVLVKRFAESDRTRIAGLRLSPEKKRELEVEVSALRRASFLGLHEGGASTDRRRPPTTLLDEPRLRVALVVHGFPPDTWAGTEVYTLELAKALERRGHEVAILARSPGDRPVSEGGPEEFSLVEDSFQGLRVWRLIHRLDHGNLQQSYLKPHVEPAFRRFIDRFEPDIVHFQHLIHFSVSLVKLAKQLGLPTIVHTHDYWALCARVQLIRPDGQRCHENMGAGCLLCVKEKNLGQIERFKRLGELGGRFFAGAVDKLGHKSGSGLARRRFEGLRDLLARQETVLPAFAAADLLVSPSRFLREKLLATGAFDPHLFVYSDNGLRTDHVAALDKRPDPEGRLRVGFVGSLVWYKGVDVLLKAMRRLTGKPVVARIFGGFDPAKDPHHRELAELAGPNVEFRGRFDNARLSEVYAELDLLVVPSVWYENSPITIHEAYLTRTPVLASRLGGMAEYVRDGVDGLLFEPGSDADLAATIERFLGDRELLGRLSRDFMRVKTIDENGAETEFRYRALIAQQRVVTSTLLLDVPATQAERLSGQTEVQGGVWLLMRPERSSASFTFRLRGAPKHVTGSIEIFALGAEREVGLGGKVDLDGQTVLEIAPFAGQGADQVQRFEWRAEVQPGRRRLTIETAPGHYLRLGRVRIEEAG
jgi:glycosyltransferase involved in cell wall biosynthesis